MSYQPLTTVHLLTGVPLDTSYSDTLTFANTESQANYFLSKRFKSSSNLTYQREEMFMDFPAEYDAITPCNYLMYQNTALTSKWYFAFITRMEYWNEGMTRIYFEIDSYQTFMFMITIKPCFVEREHVEDDTAGLHLIDEGLSIGDFVCNDFVTQYWDDWWIVVGSTLDLTPGSGLTIVTGKYYGNVFSGVRFYCYDNPASFGAVLDELETAGKVDAITMVFMLPKGVVSNAQQDAEELRERPVQSTNISVPDIKTLNGYTPVNNKLLCYPYRFCTISNQTGNSAELRYEMWDSQPVVSYRGSISPNGKIWMWPSKYKGMGDNYDEGITIGNYPVCAWVANTYANWLSQQQVVTAMGLSGAVVQAGIHSVSTGNVPTGIASGTTSAVNIVKNNMIDGALHSFVPAQSKGNTGGENFQIMELCYGFVVKCMSITSDYAKTIDNYFSAFGYKVNKVKMPNITGRPSWNYVKTSNAKVIGNCPENHIENIKNMLNRGVTFWHGDWVGDYTRANK